jgi:hypothetical protein
MQTVAEELAAFKARRNAASALKAAQKEEAEKAAAQKEEAEKAAALEATKPPGRWGATQKILAMQTLLEKKLFTEDPPVLAMPVLIEVLDAIAFAEGNLKVVTDLVRARVELVEKVAVRTQDVKKLTAEFAERDRIKEEQFAAEKIRSEQEARATAARKEEEKALLTAASRREYCEKQTGEEVLSDVMVALKAMCSSTDTTTAVVLANIDSTVANLLRSRLGGATTDIPVFPSAPNTVSMTITAQHVLKEAYGTLKATLAGITDLHLVDADSDERNTGLKTFKDIYTAASSKYTKCKADAAALVSFKVLDPLLTPVFLMLQTKLYAVNELMKLFAVHETTNLAKTAADLSTFDGRVLAINLNKKLLKAKDDITIAIKAIDGQNKAAKAVLTKKTVVVSANAAALARKEMRALYLDKDAPLQDVLSMSGYITYGEEKAEMMKEAEVGESVVEKTTANVVAEEEAPLLLPPSDANVFGGRVARSITHIRNYGIH